MVTQQSPAETRFCSRHHVMDCTSPCNWLATFLSALLIPLYIDLVGWVAFAIFFPIFGFYAPNVLGASDNFMPPNPMSTPHNLFGCLLNEIFFRLFLDGTGIHLLFHFWCSAVSLVMWIGEPVEHLNVNIWWTCSTLERWVNGWEN
jgi:hypothetical protein